MNPPNSTAKTISNYCAPVTDRGILKGDDKIDTCKTLYLFQTDNSSK
jgi:hypothetical protein